MTSFRVARESVRGLQEPVLHIGQVVGWITSSGYAQGSHASVAMGDMPKALFDPKGERMRG